MGRKAVRFFVVYDTFNKHIPVMCGTSTEICEKLEISQARLYNILNLNQKYKRRYEIQKFKEEDLQ